MTQRSLSHCPLTCQPQDQLTYGSLSPRMREVAEVGWQRFLDRAFREDDDGGDDGGDDQ
ncbi:hypothetical protein J7E97_01780 [Streptomyces sp. ISL-66]|uniref:hypothetical protein n=1 Tax=Streptomyces sp. ISL-66 TaxID=2819186 RepID=UPI001BED38AE|nr:hypothetical protein [Streptomyces sp. ISL-66]MBT2466626.1 hypothetical protein [Streptomyces sp. ISL-66]